MVNDKMRLIMPRFVTKNKFRDLPGAQWGTTFSSGIDPWYVHAFCFLAKAL
jgi:hypothetical protein